MNDPSRTPTLVRHAMQFRPPGRIVTLLLILFAMSAIGAIIPLAQRRMPQKPNHTILLYQVARGDFEAFVTEPGDVNSSSNVEVRCQVESRGAAGTAILKICEEGTQVKPGDFLMQFDDSLLQNELVAQKIVVANDKALLIQARSDLSNAERTLREFVDGLFQQECELLESALFVAEEELRKTNLALESTRRMAARGLVTRLQVTAAEFATEKTKKDVAAAQRTLDVYKRFTKEKMVGEYEAEIEKQRANVEAAQYTADLSRQKLADIEEQIDHCYVTAPAEGQVVYANERGRREVPIVIEEGTLIRKNQIVIRLPDIRKMQVDVKINESHVNRVKLGQPARIVLDADPKNELAGHVSSVAPYPFPQRWHGAPLEYGAEVVLEDPPSTIRPGLRAKVKILFDSQRDVLQVPLASIIEHGGRHYCLLRVSDDWQIKTVKIGSNNNRDVVVLNGLAEGDMLALTPFRHIERSDLPELDAASSGKPDAGPGERSG